MSNAQCIVFCDKTSRDSKGDNNKLQLMQPLLKNEFNMNYSPNLSNSKASCNVKSATVY